MTTLLPVLNFTPLLDLLLSTWASVHTVQTWEHTLKHYQMGNKAWGILLHPILKNQRYILKWKQHDIWKMWVLRLYEVIVWPLVNPLDPVGLSFLNWKMESVSPTLQGYLEDRRWHSCVVLSTVTGDRQEVLLLLLWLSRGRTHIPHGIVTPIIALVEKTKAMSKWNLFT